MDNLKELLAPPPAETEGPVTNMEVELMVGNQHQHPQNHQHFQFYQNRELPKQEALSSHFTGRTGPARGTLRVRVSYNFLSCFSWSFLLDTCGIIHIGNAHTSCF